MTNTLYDGLEKTDSHLGIGSRLAPLFTWRGRNVYPLFGAEGEADDDGSPDGDQDADDDTDTGEEGDDNGSTAVTREDFEKLRKQLSASDKNRSAAEKKLKEIEDAKKDELTKATERVEELTQANEKLSQETATLRMHNAFLMADTGITWHDPADALALAERQGYLKEVVDGDGTVDQAKMTSKMKELAKAKPHLVKTDAKNQDSGGKETKPPTGQKVGSKVGTTSGGKADEVPSRYQKHLR